MQDLKGLARLILKTELSNRELGAVHGCSHNTVNRYRNELKLSQLTLIDVEMLTEDALYERLSGEKGRKKKNFVIPDWAGVHASLAQPSVTLTILYEEYSIDNPQAMSATEFRRRYKQYRRTLGISMRQVHVPGLETFVDFSGKRPVITNPTDGTTTPVELFVATIGSSRKTFAYAVPSQRIEHWIEAHVQMMSFYGAATIFWVPDNLKSAIISHNRKGIVVNDSYAKAADHYSAVVKPARPRKAKDKATVEVHVRIVQWYVLGRLRNRVFYSLDELNKAITEQLEKLNNHPMRKMGGKSRSELYLEVDLPAMQPLPKETYEFAAWKLQVRVGQDYHVEWSDGYYSVPCTLVTEKVDIKATARAVTIYHKNVIVAVHLRVARPGEMATIQAHRPVSHQSYSRDQFSDLVAWAETVGGSVHEFAQAHIATHRAPQASVQALRGLKSLHKMYGSDRLLKSCERALRLNARSISTVRSQLEKNMESRPLSTDLIAANESRHHENVRGQTYYE